MALRRGSGLGLARGQVWQKGESMGGGLWKWIWVACPRLEAAWSCRWTLGVSANLRKQSFPQLLTSELISPIHTHPSHKSRPHQPPTATHLPGSSLSSSWLLIIQVNNAHINFLFSFSASDMRKLEFFVQTLSLRRKREKG